MASSFTRFLDYTQRRITIGRTPLEEWSARRRDLYRITHNTHNRQTFMLSAVFEPTIPSSEQPQTQTLDSAATGIGTVVTLICLNSLWCCYILRFDHFVSFCVDSFCSFIPFLLSLLFDFSKKSSLSFYFQCFLHTLLSLNSVLHLFLYQDSSTTFSFEYSLLIIYPFIEISAATFRYFLTFEASVKTLPSENHKRHKRLL